MLLQQVPAPSIHLSPPAVTAKFVGTLDYIFYDPNTLKPTQILVLPTEDTVRLEGSLPSSRFASDHLPLLAHFDFTHSLPSVHRPPHLSGVPHDGEQSASATSPKRDRDGGGREGRGRSQRSRPRPRQRN